MAKRAKKPMEFRVRRIEFGNWGIYKEGRKSPVAKNFETQEWAEDMARNMAEEIVYTKNRPVTVYTHGVRGHIRRQKTFHV
jgi:hypothetical protein